MPVANALSAPSLTNDPTPTQHFVGKAVQLAKDVEAEAAAQGQAAPLADTTTDKYADETRYTSHQRRVMQREPEPHSAPAVSLDDPGA